VHTRSKAVARCWTSCCCYWSPHTPIRNPRGSCCSPLCAISSATAGPCSLTGSPVWPEVSVTSCSGRCLSSTVWGRLTCTRWLPSRTDGLSACLLHPTKSCLFLMLSSAILLFQKSLVYAKGSCSRSSSTGSVRVVWQCTLVWRTGWCAWTLMGA
jgi:hypothetical protein